MSGSGQCSLFVYNKNVFNEPGTRVATTTFSSSSGWKTVNFPTPPSFSSEFFIVIALPPDAATLGIDQALNHEDRMVCSRNAIGWDKGVVGWGIDEDNMIRAIVSTVSSITVTDPDGLESWERGISYDITWTSDGVSSNVDIELWKDGSEDSDIATNIANNGSYSWAIPASQTLGTDYKVRIISVDNPSIWDDSDNDFSITGTGGIITVAKPNGTESWSAESSHNITWTSSGVSGNVKIELYKGGSFNIPIASDTHNNGSYNWAIPASQTPGTDYKVRITSIDSSSIWDESDGDFSITKASGILVIEPNGGKSWARDNSYDIIWTSGIPESVWDTVIYAISSPHPYPNSYDTTWVISDLGTEKMKVHFSDFNTLSGDYVYLYDKNDNQIASYDGNIGAFWSQEIPGDTVKVRLVSNFMWNAYGFDIDKYVAFHIGEDYNVKIELYKGVSKDIDIATVPANPALYSWAIPASQTPGTDYKMRIIRVDNPSVWDESDSCFSIIDVGTEEEVISLPKVYGLSQVCPNPAVQKTIISYQLPAKSEVSLRIYNAVGELIKVLANNEEKEPGYHNVRWNAEGLASGIYFVKFIAGNYKVTKKLILLR